MPLIQTRGAASAQGFGEFAQSASVAANYIEEVFSTYLYTGNGSTQTITNNIDLSTKGGLVWLKGRSLGYSNYLFDTARGVGNSIYSNLQNAQASSATTLTAFGSTGFSIGSESDINENATTYVSWSFCKQAKFFDVVTYTGTGSNTTIAHSLGAVPGCIMVKRTDTGGSPWAVYHRSLANTQYLVLNSTAVAATGATWWNSTTPTSAVFSVGTDASVNASGGTYVAYLFAHNAGGFGLTGTDNVISCGSYVGTGAVGNTITLGYEPQWLMVKNITAANDWIIYDNMRGMPASSTNTGNTKFLKPNLSNAEAGGNTIAPTATGFEINTIAAVVNTTSDTYIYIAIRRGPMKVPTTGTSVYQGNTYTGNATLNTTVAGNFGFPVDLMLLSSRSANATDWTTYGHYMIDRLRGQDKTLGTAFTSIEVAGWQTYNAFDVKNSIGWGLYGASSDTGYMNNSGGTWVAHGLRRAPSFMDVVCYTGTGSARTISHNLGVAPELYIVKGRSSVTGWSVGSTQLTALQNLLLNADDAVDSSAQTWNSTYPTASVFSVGGSGQTNGSGTTFVAYLFATCAGVSKVGSYTGNGSTQTINCGFGAGGARFVLLKRTNAVGDWWFYDTARGMTTLTDPYLRLNTTGAEGATLGSVTTVSTGFALNAAVLNAINVNAGTYIFLAIA